MEQRYCRTENQKPGPGLHVTRNLLREKDLNHELKSFLKMSKSGDVVSKLM